MASLLPLGSPAPADGALPASAFDGAADRAFGLYVHIPFCAVRCGYCDFNTYTAAELGGGGARDQYAAAVLQELAVARTVLAAAGQPARALSSVFFGGGTPTLLPASDLALILRTAVGLWGIDTDAEVSTEANPDSVTRESLAALAEAGFTRVSFGMQSAVPHVLKVLERTHSPASVPRAVRWAREAGLAVSVDLIYGTPGESVEDWRTSLRTALELNPDHISAYSLIIEDGTKLARHIRRGIVPPIDEDDHAEKYVVADEMFRQAGLDWYEVSNWSRSRKQQCRHNLAYWKGSDWWGAGPGAHSHVGGVRWWNVKHPSAYATALHEGRSPAAGREVLDGDARYVEDIMLRARLREGIPLERLRPAGIQALPELCADALVETASSSGTAVVLTDRGRLLADAVVRRLLPD